MVFLIYVEKLTPRLEYIFNHVFNHIFGLEIHYTIDKDDFFRSNTPKINYSKKAFSDELFFYSSDILFQNDIRNQELVFSTYKDIKVFFLCSNSALPFDPFASCFYMLTRYEEYLPYIKDRMGRFSAKEGIAHKNNFLTIPVVDYWVLFIKEKLIQRFPLLIFKKHKFNFINTIDIDNAFAYLEKGFVRTFVSLVRDLLQFNFKKIKEKSQVFLSKRQDPYDHYNHLLTIHRKYNLKTIFFFLLADYGFNDKNINPSNRRFQTQIKEIADYCDIGIHASYSSLTNPNNLFKEIKRLENIINREITSNRQHFLFLNIPDNYRNLIKNGIKHDYSMGFASLPGFRAGTSYNFYFFDIMHSISTDLLIHPFSIMDATLNDYMNLNSQDAFYLIKALINEVKNVEGNFISIWHNESLDYTDRWIEWDNIYEDMIKYIVNEKNRVSA